MKVITNIAGSNRAKLLALARERGEDFQFILGRWMVERFLYRLSQATYKDSFVLKGAMLFLAWDGQMHRPTRDLDLRGFGFAAIPDITGRIRTICSVAEADGILFDVADTENEFPFTSQG